MSIPENTIILLDDPGVHLHPSAQKDILNIIKKLSEDKQIFFTTHSPSMIDRNNLNGVKLVTKNGSVGTKIKGKFHASDYDIYEPIRAAIGMTLADSLFTTKKNLLVEGISDLFILEALSKFSEGENKEFIDTSKISIFPTNGAKKMSNYVPFLLKEELECVCIFDSDKEGKDAKNELISKFDVKKENIIILNDLFDEDITKDLTIEDLIDFDFYLKALNLAYKNIFVDKIGKNNMDIDDLVGESKSFKGIKKYFKDNGLNKPDKVLIAKKYLKLQLQKQIPLMFKPLKRFLNFLIRLITFYCIKLDILNIQN
ncbi:MAG: AAA family ATPase [Methanobacterium sp. ERen5]|nr:MAG: AAA family ATPase [Methanobacterium sp. ERen5]